MKYKRSDFLKIIALLSAAAVLEAACSRYEQKPIPIVSPSTVPNAVEIFKATIAAKAFSDKEKAKEYFGFDIIKAGVLPVQIIIDNQGSDAIDIVPSQTFLIDSKGQMWNIMEKNMTYNRIKEKTELGEIAPESAKGGALGAVAGATIGAAIGIVTGQNIPEAAGKGAAAGTAAGAVLGGSKGMQDPEVRRSIKEDLENRSLENKPIPPNAISHGIIFFPAEAEGTLQLRLQIKNLNTNEIVTSNMDLS